MNTDECEEISSSRKETGYTSQPSIIFTGYPAWKSWVTVKGRKKGNSERREMYNKR